MLTPSTIEELSAAIQSHPKVLPVGGRSKPRLSTPPGKSKPSLESDSPSLLSLQNIAGITEYQPSEYTITARAGTSLLEINAALAAKGQCLPFDPPLASAGATLGGTIAANLSGPGRFRFGGVRDFILGLTYLDGRAQPLVGGGKVVKNAAGFDIPKLMVGSLGRFGIITEVTFKVFPFPPATLTLRLPFDSHATAFERLGTLSQERFELDALDYIPSTHTLLIRLAGPDASNRSLASTIGGTIDSDETTWPELNAFAWAPSDHSLLKIPTSPRTALPLLEAIEALPDSRSHLTAGANTLWVSLPDATAIAPVLESNQCPAMVIRGPSPSIYLGPNRSSTLADSLKSVFDPDNRFLSSL